MRSYVIEDLRELFSDKKYSQLYLPPFQRKYCWDKSNWEVLWSDILSIKKNVASNHDDDQVANRHFLGIIVILPLHKQDRILDKEDVATRAIFTQGMLIDGQQRTTTLLILAKAILDYLHRCVTRLNDSIQPLETQEEHIQTAVAQSIASLEQLLFNRKSGIKGSAAHRLRPSHQDAQPFNDMMGGDIVPERHKKAAIVNAYRFFNQKLESEFASYNAAIAQKVLAIQEVCQLAEALVMQLNFVVVELDAGDVGSAAFADINSKGKSLTPSDLIKNMLYLKENSIKKYSEEETSVVDAIGELEQQEQNEFYLTYVKLRTGMHTVSKTKLYGCVISIAEKMDHMQFVNEIRNVITVYKEATTKKHAISAITDNKELYLAISIALLTIKANTDIETYTAIVKKIKAIILLKLMIPKENLIEHKLCSSLITQIAHELFTYNTQTIDKFEVDDDTKLIINKLLNSGLSWTSTDSKVNKEILKYVSGQHAGITTIIPHNTTVYEGEQSWQDWLYDIPDSIEDIKFRLGNYILISKEVSEDASLFEKFEIMVQDGSPLLALTTTPVLCPLLIEERTKFIAKKLRDKIYSDFNL